MNTPVSQRSHHQATLQCLGGADKELQQTVLVARRAWPPPPAAGPTFCLGLFIARGLVPICQFFQDVHGLQIPSFRGRGGRTSMFLAM